MANEVITQVLLYLSDFPKLTQKLTAGLDVSGLRYDWLIIFFFIFAILLTAWSIGRTRMLLAILTIYAASFLETHFIYFDRVLEFIKSRPAFAEFPERDPVLWLHIGLFLAFYIIIFAILNFSLLKYRLTLSEGSFVMVTGLAILEIGFLASVLFSYFPEGSIKYLPLDITLYFTTKNAQFWWATVPIIAVLFNRYKKQPEK